MDWGKPMRRIQANRMRVKAGASSLLTSLTALAVMTGFSWNTTVPATAEPLTTLSAETAGGSLGPVRGYQQQGAVVDLKTLRGVMRISFLDARTFRIEADPSGTLSDPANTTQNDPVRSANLVVGADQFQAPQLTVTEGLTIDIRTNAVRIEVNKAAGTFTARRADGSLLFQEAAPLSFSSAGATQSLTPQPGEQFLGGGMQNGRTVHTGQMIEIKRDFNWEDGGSPKSVS